MKPIVFCGVLSTVLALIPASAAVDCLKLSLTVKHTVAAEPAKVLEIVATEVSAAPDCACEIVKAAIVGASAKPETVAAIVQAAVTAAPEQMRLISQCRGGGPGCPFPSAGRARPTRSEPGGWRHQHQGCQGCENARWRSRRHAQSPGFPGSRTAGSDFRWPWGTTAHSHFPAHHYQSSRNESRGSESDIMTRLHSNFHYPHP